jgi:hypothetical protein
MPSPDSLLRSREVAFDNRRKAQSPPAGVVTRIGWLTCSPREASLCRGHLGQGTSGQRRLVPGSFLSGTEPTVASVRYTRPRHFGRDTVVPRMGSILHTETRHVVGLNPSKTHDLATRSWRRSVKRLADLPGRHTPR